MNEKQILKLASKKIKSILDKKGLILLTPDISEQYFLLGNGHIYETSNLYYLEYHYNNRDVVSNFTIGKSHAISSDYLTTRNYVLDNWEPKGHLTKAEFTTDIKSVKDGIYKVIKVSCNCIREGTFSKEESSIFLKRHIRDYTSAETLGAFKDFYT